MHRPVHFILCSCRTVPPAALLPARESRNFLVLIWFGFWLVTPVFMAGWWEGWEPAKQLCPVWCFREFRLTFCRSCQEFQRLYNHKSAYSLGLPSNKGQSTEPFRSLIRLTCQWAVLSGRIKGSHQSNVSKALFVLSSSAGWWIFKLFQQLTHSTNARSVRQCLGFASVTCSDPSVTGDDVRFKPAYSSGRLGPFILLLWEFPEALNPCMNGYLPGAALSSSPSPAHPHLLFISQYPFS